MLKRGSGILLHVSSLPSRHGIGDLGPEAYGFAERLAQAGQRYWQILPLNPSNPQNGESPYFSSSTFAGNPLLISPELLVTEGFAGTDEVATEGGTPGTVDYPAVREAKGRLFGRVWERFRSGGRREEFEGFCAAQAGWLDDYALFMALQGSHRTPSWAAWPSEVRARHPAALDTARRELAEPIDREKFLQFLFHRQWDGLRNHCSKLGITIVGDMPIYVSYESADVWSNPGMFRLDRDLKPVAVSGVPPDYFSATGQLWNNPVYNWQALQGDQYGWWRRRMTAAFERYDVVRIDHFRGLVQYWEVPAGQPTAIKGAWRDVPTDDFLGTLMRDTPGFPVIAEDLGIITDDVREAMQRYGFPGMKVLLFAFGDDEPDNPYLPHNYERNCLVYTGTHDNMTFRGWWEKEAGEQERARVGRYLHCDGDCGQVAWELMRSAQMSVADAAIVPLQDLLVLGAEARMNNPAVNEGNWRWRCTPEQMQAVPFGRLAELTRLYGRTPQEKQTPAREAGLQDHT